MSGPAPSATRSMPSQARRALFDIRACILSAQEFADGYDLDRFRLDRKTFHAVTRMLEIISEARRHLDPAVRNCRGALSETRAAVTGTMTTTWRKPTSG